MLTLLAALSTLQGDSVLDARIETALSKMTLEEKIDLLGGVDDFYIRAMPKTGLPRLKMADGPVGVRNNGPTTAYPAGFTLAATWNRALARQFGTAIGRDARARGVHIWLGPGVNLARIVQNGRNFEYVGEDPFLAGSIATEIVKGVQGQGVAATVKHFAANEHESDRNNDDSKVDERTLRELYLKPFEMVVRDSGVGAVMTSYNLVNGVHASENYPLIMDILKGEWGFQGIVMSDWGSIYSAEGPYRNGMDIEMPNGRYMNRKNLLPLIENRSLPTGILDDKIRRILRLAYSMNWDKRSQKDESIALDDPHNVSDAIQVAREGTVLLKNRDNILPLVRSTQKILVVGPNATPAATGGGGSAYTEPVRSVSVLDALRRLAPAGTTIDYTAGYSAPTVAAGRTDWTAPDGMPGVQADYFVGTELQGAPILSRREVRIDNRWQNGVVDPKVKGPFSVRWKGRYVPKETGAADLVAAADDGIRVFVDGKKVIDQWHDQAETRYVAPLSLEAGKPIDVVVEYYQGGGDASARVGINNALAQTMERDLPKDKVASADAVIACVGWNGKDRYEGEGSDRTWELPSEQEAMLRRLVSLNKHVIVVLNSGAGVATQTWINGVAGLIHAGYPGGEGNLAVAEILYGTTSPSGKLPTSFPARLEGTYYADAYPSVGRKMVYREGLLIGYRWFDANRVAPLYPFGYGLSYTSFSLSDPTAEASETIRIAVLLRNSGKRAGAETVQVYAEPPKGSIDRAPRELRAFRKVSLAPGASQRVELTFARKDLARYDVVKHDWVVDPGTYHLRVGTSSRDLPISLPITIR